MRILVLSFYFPPDLSAGSFRVGALVRALGEFIGTDDRVEVLTTQPNRYSGISQAAVAEENVGPKVLVRRFALPAHRGGFLDQALAFAAFARQVLRHVRGRSYDVVFATSSRLQTAFLGAIVARMKRARLVLDLRDIFVDTLQDVMPPVARLVMIPLFRRVERWTVRGATHVNLVSEGFRQYFVERYPEVDFGYIPNGIDDEFIGGDFRGHSAINERRVILYAGNIGDGQGLHRIVPALADALRESWQLRIVGDGGRRAELAKQIEGLDNVQLLSPMSRKELIALYGEADVLFLHLNDYPAFRKVLPSKLFEYAATGKPILAGVSGYPAEFVSSIPNASVFPPCDTIAAVTALMSLELASVDRAAFVRTYRRDALMRALAERIVKVGRSPL